MTETIVAHEPSKRTRQIATVIGIIAGLIILYYLPSIIMEAISSI